MTRRTTLTVICDNCGRMSQHEIMTIGYEETIYCAAAFPADWATQKRIGGGDLSPVLDYCPTCKEHRHGKKENGKEATGIRSV